MEERHRSVLEDDDDELDADGKPKKNRRAVVDKKDKPRVPLKSFGDNLNDLFSAKKTTEPEKEESAKTKPEETLVEAEDAEDKFNALEGLNGRLPNHEAIDLQLHEPMEDVQELPLNFSAISQYGRIPQNYGPKGGVERLDADKSDSKDEEPAPQFFLSQPLSEALRADAPLAASEGSGGGHEPPPRGPETPPPEPNPDPGRQQGEALMATMPDSMRSEYAQHGDTIDPNREQPTPTNDRQETRIVERRGGGALIAVVFDWLGRRGIRKELRGGQTKQDKQIERIKQAQTEARRQQQHANAEQALKEQQLWRDLSARPTTTELMTQHRHMPAERLRPIESVPRSAAEKATAPHERIPEQVIEEQPVPLPPEHRMVHSEWHSIEVDKSGHPVEQPVLAYGQEFKREQHQEARRQDELAAAGLAGSSAVNTVMGISEPGSLANNAAPQSLKSTVPLPISQRAVQANDNSTDLLLWIILIVIILAIIAALVLR